MMKDVIKIEEGGVSWGGSRPKFEDVHTMKAELSISNGKEFKLKPEPDILQDVKDKQDPTVLTSQPMRPLGSAPHLLEAGPSTSADSNDERRAAKRAKKLAKRAMLSGAAEEVNVVISDSLESLSPFDTANPQGRRREKRYEEVAQKERVKLKKSLNLALPMVRDDDQRKRKKKDKRHKDVVQPDDLKAEASPLPKALDMPAKSVDGKRKKDTTKEDRHVEDVERNSKVDRCDMKKKRKVSAT